VPAYYFSSTLLALITTSKALVVYYAYCQREEAALAARADSAPSTSKLIGKMSTQFIVLLDYSYIATPIN
jgi:hypothetical protein